MSDKIEIDPAILDGISTALKKMWEEIDRAKQAKPEVEFWGGQLVRRGHTRGIHVYESRSEFTSDHSKLISSDGKFITVSTASIRPLQDPLIDQYKPLAEGEYLPTTYGDQVWIRFEDGAKARIGVGAFNSYRENYKFAIGWMPADGWGRSE